MNRCGECHTLRLTKQLSDNFIRRFHDDTGNGHYRLSFFSALMGTAAFAEVDLRTPWANVYVGPGGVYVHGPWGRVDVPASDRERVCSEWRKSAREHYEARGCNVEFDDEECVIEELDCDK